VHESGLCAADRTERDRIPVTTVARTLFDLAELVGEQELERAAEEADRLGLLTLRALRDVCDRGEGRHALRPIRRLIDAARAPTFTRSALEGRFARLCREHGIDPVFNAAVLGHEVDAHWPAERLIVELDGFAFHKHRAAFERDRTRDAAMQAEGYRVVRITYRRLEREPAEVAKQLRRLLHAAKEGRAGD
jgi:very-short-patch-repair endonuclease